MKALIAATCVAILATVGYYFWGEYSEAKAQRERDAEIAVVRAQVFEDARASPGDYAKARQHCDFVRKNRDSQLFGDYAKIASSRCILAGF